MCAAAASIGLLTACGGSDEDSSTAAATAAAPATTAAAPASTTASSDTTASDATPEGEPVTDYLAFVGGTAGAADTSKSPIPLGWINTEGGQIFSFPAATTAAKAAVKYVNAELGGVGGHPVKLASCIIVQNEEEGQACAQEMMNDKDVNVINLGLVATGGQSIFATVNGAKPIIVGSPASPAARTAKNTYALSGTESAVFGPWGTFSVDNLKAKEVAVVFPQIAGADSGAAEIKKALEQAGAKVNSVGYDANLNDLLGPLTAAGAQNADAIVPVADGPNCVKIAKALDQIGSDVPVVAVPNCLDPQVQKALGDFPKWYYGIAATLSADTTAPDVQAYQETSKKYGLSTPESFDPFAQLAWGQILLTVKLMNEIGPDAVTADSFGKAMADYTGTYPMGPPALACGSSPPSEPASCNDKTQFYQYDGGGKFTLSAAWVGPPS